MFIVYFGIDRSSLNIHFHTWKKRLFILFNELVDNNHNICTLNHLIWINEKKSAPREKDVNIKRFFRWFIQAINIVEKMIALVNKPLM